MHVILYIAQVSIYTGCCWICKKIWLIRVKLWLRKSVMLGEVRNLNQTFLSYQVTRSTHLALTVTFLNRFLCSSRSLISWWWSLIGWGLSLVNWWLSLIYWWFSLIYWWFISKRPPPRIWPLRFSSCFLLRISTFSGLGPRLVSRGRISISHCRLMASPHIFWRFELILRSSPSIWSNISRSASVCDTFIFFRFRRNYWFIMSCFGCWGWYVHILQATFCCIRTFFPCCLSDGLRLLLVTVRYILAARVILKCGAWCSCCCTIWTQVIPTQASVNIFQLAIWDRGKLKIGTSQYFELINLWL